jgi:uncharacterized membrane protein YraQ (UPF0718 family)
MIKKIAFISTITCFLVFTVFSFINNYTPGLKIFNNFKQFSLTFLKILPPVFILIGLFSTWVKRETVEKHIGTETKKAKNIFWALILSSTIVGGLYTAIPVAYVMRKKGARYLFIFTFLGGGAVLRVPMSIFEATILGLKFTLIRLILAIPFVIISALLIEKYYKKIKPEKVNPL